VTTAVATPPTVGTQPVAARVRLDAVDFVRGLVMILMVLDHTRDFAHVNGLLGNPLDPGTTTVALYLTRWVTHLCAPTFVLLAGLGVGLRRIRGAAAADNAWFLFTRGLWLIAMELGLLRLIIWWDADLGTMFALLQVIWAIGVSMVLLSALVRLPLAALGVLAAALLLGHNLLDGIRVAPWFPGSPAPPPSAADIGWMLLHQNGFFPVGGANGPAVFGQYPILPWFGLLTAGYVMADIYRWSPDRRRRALYTAVVVMVVAFGVLRTSNIYGDPIDWAPQATAIQSAMAFMNVQKYPPSLSFLLVTLLPALTLLAALDGRTIAGGLRGVVVTFGRVPFFFYVLQWITAHVSGLIVTAALGKSIGPLFANLVDLLTMQPPPDIGGPLWAVYLCWIVSLFVMYPLCRWFAGVKSRRREWWLSYL
jgi:uncharacterized membrane protein